METWSLKKFLFTVTFLLFWGFTISSSSGLSSSISFSNSSQYSSIVFFALPFSAKRVIFSAALRSSFHFLKFVSFFSFAKALTSCALTLIFNSPTLIFSYFSWTFFVTLSNSVRAMAKRLSLVLSRIILLFPPILALLPLLFLPLLFLFLFSSSLLVPSLVFFFFLFYYFLSHSLLLFLFFFYFSFHSLSSSFLIFLSSFSLSMFLGPLLIELLIYPQVVVPLFHQLSMVSMSLFLTFPFQSCALKRDS